MYKVIDLSGYNHAVLAERISAHIVRITINRPEARNAINGDVARALDHLVKFMDADPDIYVAILTGAGNAAFCAGADLKEIAAGRADHLRTPDGGFAGFVHADRKTIWIAALNGLALAGGFEIALACDLVVATEAVEFALPEVKRGLMALAGGLYRLPRALPYALALELIATGERLKAERAYQHGLINRLVPADRLYAEAISLAEKICENAPVAVQESIRIAKRSHALDEQALITLCNTARAKLILTQDYQEGPLAFIERRAPRWTGR
jgi:enoyl-CoA hydratase/carnithine racemase